MKNLLITILCVCCLAQSACERDDICAETTPTTPLLVIDFYDADDTSVLKAPVNLNITADETLTTIPTVNESTVSIPLRTDQDVTSFTFTINGELIDDGEEEEEEEDEDDELDEINADQITFSYTRTEEFVSTACGFRITYNDLQETRDSLDDGSWIQDINITNSTVDEEAITHVIIFH